ncbi:MAG: hypothetical protein SNJ70_08775 [Armatimonadota bacterium]
MFILFDITAKSYVKKYVKEAKDVQQRHDNMKSADTKKHLFYILESEEEVPFDMRKAA